MLLEGEEECGSPSLPDFIAAHRQELECDVAFICDAEMWSPTQPAITTQLKGLVHERVTIHALNPDLQSGHFGAVAANPIRILSGILADIHDDAGCVRIDGFYDDVQDIPLASSVEMTPNSWPQVDRHDDSGVRLNNMIIAFMFEIGHKLPRVWPIPRYWSVSKPFGLAGRSETDSHDRPGAARR